MCITIAKYMCVNSQTICILYRVHAVSISVISIHIHVHVQQPQVLRGILFLLGVIVIFVVMISAELQEGISWSVIKV